MMTRRLSRWLTPLLVLALCSAAAHAAGGDPDAPPERVGVLGYLLAFLFTVGAMVIVCMPARKT